MPSLPITRIVLDKRRSVWAPTTFTKNRDRLLEGDIARAFFEDVVAQARARRLLSAEHFTVDGTLLEAWIFDDRHGGVEVTAPSFS